MRSTISRYFCIDTLCLCCCCPTRRNKVFRAGKRITAAQLDIAEVLKKLILFDILLKMRNSKLERYFLKRHNRFALSPKSPKLQALAYEIGESSFSSDSEDKSKISVDVLSAA